MVIELGLLPDLGKWAGAVGQSVFALQLLVGGLCAVTLAIRAYRVLLQGLALVLGK